MHVRQEAQIERDTGLPSGAATPKKEGEVQRGTRPEKKTVHERSSRSQLRRVVLVGDSTTLRVLARNGQWKKDDAAARGAPERRYVLRAWCEKAACTQAQQARRRR